MIAFPNGDRTLLEAALAYANCGLRVIPLQAIQNGACTCTKSPCPSPGKHPRISDWPASAAMQPDVIEQWWTTFPAANIGIVLARGQVVLDVDPRNGGDTSLAALERAFGPLPPTIQVRTGGGGFHYYFATSCNVEQRGRARSRARCQG